MAWQTGPQSYTRNYKQWRKGGSGKDGLLQGRVTQLVVQCQTVNPKNLHTSNIIPTGQFTLRNSYA